MKVKTIKKGKEYVVEFSQGNQSFLLEYTSDEEDCRWMVKMLRKAFKAYKEEILKTNSREAK